jgi:hypothetical protein
MMQYFKYLLCLSLFIVNFESLATQSTLEFAKSIADRPQGDSRIGYMHFTLTNNSGSEKSRTALFVLAQHTGQIKFAVYFISPAAIQNTAFLCYDNEGSIDESWLYLPTTEGVRRLSASALSDAFFGTGLDYGDVKNDFGLKDWDLTTLTNVEIGNIDNPKLQGKIKNNERLDEQGYKSFSAIVDPSTFFLIHIEFNDVNDSSLKAIEMLKQQKIDVGKLEVIFSLNQRDDIVRLILKNDVNDNLVLQIGIDFIFSNEEGQFGQFEACITLLELRNLNVLTKFHGLNTHI